MPKKNNLQLIRQARWEKKQYELARRLTSDLENVGVTQQLKFNSNIQFMMTTLMVTAAFLAMLPSTEAIEIENQKAKSTPKSSLSIASNDKSNLHSSPIQKAAYSRINRKLQSTSGFWTYSYEAMTTYEKNPQLESKDRKYIRRLFISEAKIGKVQLCKLDAFFNTSRSSVSFVAPEELTAEKFGAAFNFRENALYVSVGVSKKDSLSPNLFAHETHHAFVHSQNMAAGIDADSPHSVLPENLNKPRFISIYEKGIKIMEFYENLLVKLEKKQKITVKEKLDVQSFIEVAKNYKPKIIKDFNSEERMKLFWNRYIDKKSLKIISKGPLQDSYKGIPFNYLTKVEKVEGGYNIYTSYVKDVHSNEGCALAALCDYLYLIRFQIPANYPVKETHTAEKEAYLYQVYHDYPEILNFFFKDLHDFYLENGNDGYKYCMTS